MSAVSVDRRRRAVGYGSMAIAATTWGSLVVIVPMAAAPAVVLVTLRMGFGAAALGVFLGVFGRGDIVPRGQLRGVAALGGLLAVSWVTFFRAIELLPGAVAVLVLYVFPVLVAVAAPAVLRERREPYVLPLALLGFVGVAAILAPQGLQGNVAGVAFAVLSAVTLVAFLLGARYFVRTVDGPVIAFWQNLAGFALLLPLAVAAGAPAGVPWMWGAVIGVVHTALMGVLFYRAIGRVPAPQAGVLMYLEPVSALVFAWVMLGHVPGWSALSGGALVLGAGAVLVLKESRGPAP